MFEFSPDYSSYSTTELLNSLSLVDRERFAGRLADIRSELARRGVRYEESREMVGEKPRYKVKLLQTVPSENLSKQWQQTSHDVEIGDEDENKTAIFDEMTYWLVAFAAFWWYSDWTGNFTSSMLSKSLVMIFIGTFVLMLGPKAMQRNNEALAAQAKKTLLLMVAVGICVLPFAFEMLHKMTAKVTKPRAVVLEIYNGKFLGCADRALLEIENGQIFEVCHVPNYTLDKIRPNDQLQIELQKSIFGTSVESGRMNIIWPK